MARLCLSMSKNFAPSSQDKLWGKSVRNSSKYFPWNFCRNCRLGHPIAQMGNRTLQRALQRRKNPSDFYALGLPTNYAKPLPIIHFRIAFQKSSKAEDSKNFLRTYVKKSHLVKCTYSEELFENQWRDFVSSHPFANIPVTHGATLSKYVKKFCAKFSRQTLRKICAE